MKKIVLGLFLCICQLSWTQQSEELDEIILTADRSLKEFSNTQQVRVLTDSILQTSPARLTSLLQFHSSIYLKENGAGMVSSPSFRGTTAAQTAVIWNGININSLSTGQTDFNTVNIRAFDQISVKAGGGSTTYGSSAIGGTIHLNNQVIFGKSQHQHRLWAAYASYDTYELGYGTKLISPQTSVHLSLYRLASENDYPLYGKGFRNINGAYQNNNLSVAVAHQINPNHVLTYYGNIFDGERHFAVISPQAIKTKYQDFNLRNLLEWTAQYQLFTSTLRLAYLQENFKYFPFLESDHHTLGSLDTKLIQYHLDYKTRRPMQLGLILDYYQNQGFGTEINAATRQSGGVGLKYKNQWSRWLSSELLVKKEFTDSYSSPLLYAVGAQINVSSAYLIQAHFSKNYRIPTFNDMYWHTGGDPNLQPELSWQGEVSQEVVLPYGKISLTAYYNHMQHMLLWLPVSGSFWQAENIGEVVAYGLELGVEGSRSWNSQTLAFSANYSYTRSENQETGRQLIYVPYHQGKASLVFSRKRYQIFYRYAYTGAVYTASDHSHLLPAYQLSEVGAAYEFKPGYQLGFQVFNLWDEKYSSVKNRPMPGRNFSMYINLNL